MNTVDLNMNEIRSQVFGLLLENLKENAELPPESDVVQLASEVLIDLASKEKNNSADLASKTIDGRRKTRRFTLHPTRRRPLDPNSSTKSQASFVRLKSALIVDFVKSILRADTAHERFMARRVLDNVAQKIDGAVRKIHYKFKTFDIKEPTILRDGIGTSTTGMVKISSLINAMRPKLEDVLEIQLFPHCYAARFIMNESSNNLELVTAMVPLQVKKDDTLTKPLPFAYLKRP